MFPFDRLIRAMDAWAAAQPEPVPLLAQIGDGGFEPAHMRWVRSLPRDDYARTVAEAEVVVAHAGMGSVITAGEYGKPIVLVPRRAASGRCRPGGRWYARPGRRGAAAARSACRARRR